MRSATILMLNKIVTQKSHELGFQVIKPEHSENVVSLLREDWHLFLEMCSPIVSSLLLQMTISVEDEAVRMLLFPSPAIIDRRNTMEYILEENRFRTVGRQEPN